MHKVKNKVLSSFQQFHMVLQADEVKHNVSDKLHQLQHRAESSPEDAQQKASETSAKVNCLSAVLAVRSTDEQCVVTCNMLHVMMHGKIA